MDDDERIQEEGYNSRALECGSQRKFPGSPLRPPKTKHRNSFSVPSDQILLPSSASVNMSSRSHQLRSASDNKLMVINWLRDIHRCNLFSWNCWQGKNCLPALFTLSSSCAAARMDVCFLEGAGNSSASRSGANQTNVAQLLSLRGISSCSLSPQRTEDDEELEELLRKMTFRIRHTFSLIVGIRWLGSWLRSKLCS